MKRRTFVKSTSLALAASAVSIHAVAMHKKKNLKLGLQAFTIRDALATDLVGTLETVKSLGYEDLELYGFDVIAGTYYGHKATEFKTILENCGLTSSSCHYGFTDYVNADKSTLLSFVDKCIAGALTLNNSYITWPWMAPEHRNAATFDRLPELLNTIGAHVNKSGLEFAYHNHDFEFHNYDGSTGFSRIINQTDPALVKIQLDLYWAVHSSKVATEDLISKAPERYVMWHIKDMDKVTRDYSELGNGSIDYSTLLPKLDDIALTHYYLEQGGNFAQNSMQSITDSVHYFKKHLQHLL